MTFEEFGVIAKAIRQYYPRETIMPTPESVALWFEELKDLDATATKTAIRKWVSTNKWSPSIAEIREQVAAITNPKIKDWSEAYEDARMAVRRYGSYNPQAAFDSLDELTRTTVKRIGYYDMCMSENKAADRANFRMIYETLAKRQTEERQINTDVKNMIEMLGEKLGISDKVQESWEKEKRMISEERNEEDE